MVAARIEVRVVSLIWFSRYDAALRAALWVQVVGAAERACSAIAIMAEPPNTMLMPTRMPSAQAAVPGKTGKDDRGEDQVDDAARSSTNPHCPERSRL